MTRLKRAALILAVCCTAYAGPVLTELKPRGAQRGKAFTLILAGKDLTPGAQIVSSLPATFTPLTPPSEGPAMGRELPFLVELNAEVPVGVYPIRLQSPEGLSNILLFSAGAFPEVNEAESEPKALEHSNDSLQTAQQIHPPVTVNGTLSGPDRDFYRIHAGKGERLVIEVEARRAGSAIDPVLRVLDSSGKLIAKNDDGFGLGEDARIDLTFPREGDYYVEVHDARFSEQFQNFYRLKVGNFSYADGLFPLGWKRGEKPEVEFFGGNLTAPVKVKADLTSLNANADFTRVAVPGSPGSLPFLFAVSDLPEILAPSGAGKEPVALPPSTVINGRILRLKEVDRYKLPVSPGEYWEVDLQAKGLGTSQLDGVVTVYDGKGKKLASGGDIPPKEDAFSLLSSGRTTSDPYVSLKVPQEVRELVVTVEDLAQRGGPGYAYRLVAKKQPPDFALTVANPYLNIPAKGTVTINVLARRRGYIGPIQLGIPNLGDDFIVEGGHIPGEVKATDAYAASQRGVLTITAKPEAKPKMTELEVWGEAAMADGQVVRHRARGLGMITDIAGGTGISDAEGRENQNPFVAPWLNLALPVMLGREVASRLETDGPKIIRLVQGTAYDLKWNFKSTNPDMKPPETVGVDVPAPVAAEIQVRRAKPEQKQEKYAEKGAFTILTTTNTPPGKFDLVLSGRSKGEEDEGMLATPAVTLEVLQGYKIEGPHESLVLQPGSKMELVGRLQREPEFSQTVTVKVDNLPAHVNCGSVKVAPEAKDFRLPCEAEAAAQAGEYKIQLASSSVLPGRDKREVPYNIAPVEAKLVVSGQNKSVATR